MATNNPDVGMEVDEAPAPVPAAVPEVEFQPPVQGQEEEQQPQPPPRPRFAVKEWRGCAVWGWDIVVQSCAICRNHIMEPCLECQANHTNQHGAPGPPPAAAPAAAIGICGHAFRFHCISRWLQARHVCPLDNSEWVYQNVQGGAAGH